MTEQQVLEDYYRIERLLCMDDPFYGYLLMNLRKFVNKIPRQKNKTMCVFLNDTDYCLNISSYFWEALPNDTIKLSMVKHEANIK